MQHVDKAKWVKDFFPPLLCARTTEEPNPLWWLQPACSRNLGMQAMRHSSQIAHRVFYKQVGTDRVNFFVVGSISDNFDGYPLSTNSSLSCGWN